MQAITLKLNRHVSATILAVLLAVSSLAACGQPASPASAVGAGAAPRTATSRDQCDEGCRALHRLSIAPTSECDEGYRAAARMGITVSCRNR